MNTSEDYYAILGIDETASAAEIKTRFRFLSQAYHPDKFGSDAHKQVAEEEFKRINEAYQILSDTPKRTRYDASRSKPSSSPAQPSPRDEAPASVSVFKKRAAFIRMGAISVLATVALVLLIKLIISLNTAAPVPNQQTQNQNPKQPQGRKMSLEESKEKISRNQKKEAHKAVPLKLDVPSGKADASPKPKPVRAPNNVEVMGKNGVGNIIILYKERPKYTEAARANKTAGTVVLSVVFTADGHVTDIRVISGLADGLTEAAIEAAKKLRFVPAQKNGQPVNARGSLEIPFFLQ